jgi:hypothetical protein
MMARIKALPERKAGLLARLAYRFSRRRLGEVAEPLAITARHPGLLLGYGVFELALARSHRVDERLKEMAALKAATLVGCPF